MISNFFTDALLPRTVYLPYLVAKFVLFFIGVGRRLLGIRLPHLVDSTLCIEAGVRGWESIEFKELYQSACEYLRAENVQRLIIQPEVDYVEQVARVLSTRRITHYFYDPRTGSQNLLLGFWQSLRVAILLQNHNVVPIAFLTNLAVRNWRSKSAIVSARRGLVVCMMAPRRVAPIFPHRRLLGPSLMPFSVQTKQMLDALIEKRPQNIPAKAVFAGSLYEPRTTVLEKIQSGLAARGLVFEIKGRVLGSARFPDSEYWSRLCNSDIVVTTAYQRTMSGADWTNIPLLVYRYLEVLACGALLVATDFPSVRRYFTPGEHFISFDSPEHAVDEISYFLQNDTDRLKIAQQGKDRADALISSRCFWMSIDALLGVDSMY